MNKSILLGAATFGLSAALLASCTSGAKDTSVAAAGQFCGNPAPFPVGYNYPQSAQTVQSWVSQRNITAARQHGWNLFAGLQTDVSGKWVWRSWCTATQAFAGQTPPSPAPTGGAADLARASDHGQRPMRVFKQANGPTSGSEPINFKVAPVYAIPGPVAKKYAGTACIIPPSGSSPIPTLASGTQFQNNGDVMVAGVIYNDAAYQWIRSKNLFQTSTLQSLLPPANQNKQMDQMPVGSIVLKPMLWPVKKTGYTALPVWDDLKSDFDRYSGFEIQSQWPRGVAVTPQSKSQIATVDVTYLNGVTMNNQPLGPNTYKQARTVGIERFYNFQPDLATLGACDRALLDASAHYAYGRMFEQGDYLALVAMHIMTKEQPDWTFQSVWWSDRAGTGPYAADRPSIPAAKGPWQNYLMTSTYGWRDLAQPVNWPIAYNPYIELAADHPIQTNCMNCHHRAAWPQGPNAGSYLRADGPSALAAFKYQNQPIFNGLIGVDSVWSISDRVPAPKPPSSASASAASAEPAQR